MTKKRISKKKLNYTLLFIAKLLNSNNINKWFIAYGTLLGIVRENSCIDNDDDIDIICDKNDYNKIKELLKNKFTFHYDLGIGNSKNILKTKETDEYSSIDFYMAEIDKNGNYYEPQERIIWQKCYLNGKLIKKVWNETILYLPNNAVKKLVGRYGKNWKIPCEHKKFWVIEGLPKNKII